MQKHMHYLNEIEIAWPNLWVRRKVSQSKCVFLSSNFLVHFKYLNEIYFYLFVHLKCDNLHVKSDYLHYQRSNRYQNSVCKVFFKPTRFLQITMNKKKGINNCNLLCGLGEKAYLSWNYCVQLFWESNRE